MLDNEILEFYDRLRLPYDRLLEIGQGRHRLKPYCIEEGMKRIYEQRGSFPKIATGHRVFLEARTVTPPPPEEMPQKKTWWERWLFTVIDSTSGFLFPK